MAAEIGTVGIGTVVNAPTGNGEVGGGTAADANADAAGGGPLARVVRPTALPVLDASGQAQQRHFEAGVARLEAEMEAARRGGVLGLWRLKYEAWLEQRMQGPAIAKMQARQAVLAEQCKTAEAEIRLRATVQSGEVGAQRHRIEWNEVNRQRLAGELQALGVITLSHGPAASAPAHISPSQPPVAAHVTDEQVEAVALRGFVQGVETEEDWLAYRGELSRHLSPYAVEEVGSRLRELWRLHRQAGG